MGEISQSDIEAENKDEIDFLLSLPLSKFRKDKMLMKKRLNLTEPGTESYEFFSKRILLSVVAAKIRKKK